MTSNIELPEDVRVKFEKLSLDLKLGKTCDGQAADERLSESYLSSYHIAFTTAQLLLNVVSHGTWSDSKELINLVRDVGRRLECVQPSEWTVGNIVKRVLKLIREEASGGEESEEETMLIASGHVEPQQHREQEVSSDELKSSVIDAINELIMEIETSSDNISMQGLEHIHYREIIMTAGRSKTVETFLKRAAKGSGARKFHVIVAECAPFYHGRELGRSLAEAGIETTVITDSAVFAMMARVNKCIIGTHTVLADGGLKAFSGSNTLAQAAKHYSTPLIVLSPTYKVTPEYFHSNERDAFNKLLSPHPVLNSSLPGDLLSKVNVFNPTYDYVPPELVTLFITNIGGYSPTYIYRLLSELYHPLEYNATLYRNHI